MAIIVAIWILLVIALVAQEIYVVRSGQTMLLLVKRQHRHPPVSAGQRLAYAFVYLFPGFAMTVVLITAMKTAGLGAVREWFEHNSDDLFFLVVFAVVGVLNLACPTKMLRWTLRRNPELADNKTVVLITRLIGLGFIVFALAILAKL